MIKLHLLACSVLLGLTSAAQAATEFSDGRVPLELVREFGAYGQVYSSLPDNFPFTDLQLDLDLQLVGSVVQLPNIGVLLRSPRPHHEVTSALASALLSTGWVIRTSSAYPDGHIASLCRDDQGDIVLSVQEDAEGGSRLSVRLQQPVAQVDCLARMENEKQASERQTFLYSHFPRLDLPNGQSFPTAGLAGWVSGPDVGLSIERSSHAQISGTSAAAIYDFLAEQLNPDWVEDSGASGELTSGGLWLRTVSWDAQSGEDFNLLANVTVVDQGQDRYEVTVKMKTRDSQCSPAVIDSPIDYNCAVRDVIGVRPL